MHLDRTGWGHQPPIGDRKRPPTERPYPQWILTAGMVSIKASFASRTVTRRPVSCASVCATRIVSSPSASSSMIRVPCFDASGLDIWMMICGSCFGLIGEPAVRIGIVLMMNVDQIAPTTIKKWRKGKSSRSLGHSEISLLRHQCTACDLFETDDRTTFLRLAAWRCASVSKKSALVLRSICSRRAAIAPTSERSSIN